MNRSSREMKTAAMIGFVAACRLAWLAVRNLRVE
jgi:hypothetical protein